MSKQDAKFIDEMTKLLRVEEDLIKLKLTSLSQKSSDYDHNDENNATENEYVIPENRLRANPVATTIIIK